jgi:hypothetical protein
LLPTRAIAGGAADWLAHFGQLLQIGPFIANVSDQPLYLVSAKDTRLGDLLKQPRIRGEVFGGSPPTTVTLKAGLELKSGQELGVLAPWLVRRSEAQFVRGVTTFVFADAAGQQISGISTWSIFIASWRPLPTVLWFF